MIKLLLSIFFISFLWHANAVEDLHAADFEIESKTAFEAEDWAATITAVENAFSYGLDYPELHFRIGVAYYYQAEYKKALPHLMAYYEENEKDPHIQIYIYYAYALQGLYVEGNEFLKKKHKHAKYSTAYKKPALLKMLNIEVGSKSSNRSDSIGNLMYFNFNTLHEINHKLSVNLQANNIKQPAYWGAYDQSHYLVGARYYLGNKFSIKTNAQIFNMKGRIDMATVDSTYTDLGFFSHSLDTIRSNKTGFGSNIYFGIEKYFNDFSLVAYSNLYNYSTDENATYSGSVFDGTTWESDSSIEESFSSMQFGTDIKWFPHFLDYKLTIGVNAFALMGDGNMNIMYKPSIYYMITDKIHLYGDFMQFRDTHFAENEGTIIQNGIDLSNYRLNLALSYQFTKSLQAYGLFQAEEKVEDFKGWNYNYSSFILGVKMNL